MGALGRNGLRRLVVVFLSAVTVAACGGPDDNPFEGRIGTGTAGIARASGGVTMRAPRGGAAGSAGDDGCTAESCTDKPHNSDPPYPFVLAHGFFAFDKLGSETYFYRVREHLAAAAEDVATPEVDPFNDSEVRGRQLLSHVEEVLAKTGATKVNLIGHSQGGLDARVVASLRPDLVASVTTISTPHHGSPVADLALDLLVIPGSHALVDALGRIIGGVIDDQVGDKTSIVHALQQFSSAGIAEFNQRYPDAPGVFYASVAGRSARAEGGDDCREDVTVPFVTPWITTLDPLNPLLKLTGVVLRGTDGITHDGLVRARDARWGQFWGCIPADHMDEVGQILGQGPGAGNDWGYLEFYSELVAYLRSLGF